MQTFFLGLIILFVGGALYGKLCEKVMNPDDRKTPAYTKRDDVDYLPMPQWKNSLINLLNIAGTGPILGPIQGILFGPIAFITIPIGCVIGGAVHDYLSGMISLREGGMQMPEIIKKNTNKFVYALYTIFISLVLFLVGVVFVYTPGDLMATQVFSFSGKASAPSTWVIYSMIFIYYLIATIFPIDKIIGRIYPIFGALLLLSAVGVFIMLLVKGYPMINVWDNWTLNGFNFQEYFTSQHFIPTFFVTVACGILSGFHSTQITLITRTLEKEKQAKTAFYNMMILEGFIAMVWAGGAMAMIGLGAEKAGITMQLTKAGWSYFQNVNGALTQISPTSVVGVICKNMLGPIGGIIAIIGVVILPITSGDTALRSLRLIIADTFKIKQDSSIKRVGLASPVFLLVYLVLIWGKIDPSHFNIIWRYFGWSNQSISIFALISVVIWFMKHDRKKYIWIPLIPLLFYSFIISTYIVNSKIGLNLPIITSYIIGGIFTVVVVSLTIYKGNKKEPAIKPE